MLKDMKHYDHSTIEPKWQQRWDEQQLYHVDDDAAKKYYALIEFPYPSGEGLHVGHPRSFTAMDVVSRKKRMEGHAVLYPIGFDAFGLPSENFAIKTGIHPSITTAKNIETFTRQLKSLGIGFDWQRAFSTTDPDYYRWTQWIFLQFYKHGLAYKDTIPINWCLSCKIGLANEEVVNGRCERCGGQVEKRQKEQWMLKITAYADKLVDDLELLPEWWEQIKLQQRNWIGRSYGAAISFDLQNITGQADGKHAVEVFTTRPDTIFGATFLVISPELAQHWIDLGWQATDEVVDYVSESLQRSDIDRADEGKEKTGVDTGITAVNPVNQQEMPVFVADYVLGGYGTGAIMAVPAHDQRDFEFAQKYKLKILPVIKPYSSGSILGHTFPEQYLSSGDNFKEASAKQKEKEEMVYQQILEGRVCYTGSGTLMNSGQFDGLSVEAAQEKIVAQFGFAKKTNFKLRDWVFSRQRYWGEPIPMIHCAQCGWQPMPEDQLPLELPQVEKYEPTDTGESPLAAMTDWVTTTCPQCGGPATRETDTMPNWAGSSWYFLRYADPHNDQALADPEKLKAWLPVDWYNGGMEHTTLHLLYSRFWYKFLYDIGVIPKECGPEPYTKRTSQGMILGPDGDKMSKSRGNVINPDELVAEYGADTVRTYIMFMGPFNQAIPWDTNGVMGVRKFLEKVAKLADVVSDEATEELTRSLHKTIKKVGEDIEAMRFNTAVSTMMIFVNEATAAGSIGKQQLADFLLVLAPFAPHLTEELWQQLGHEGSIHIQPWPQYEAALAKDDTVEIAVQVNGKLRHTFSADADTPKDELEKTALAEEKIQPWVADKEIKRVIVVPNRLVNIVVGE